MLLHTLHVYSTCYVIIEYIFFSLGAESELFFSSMSKKIIIIVILRRARWPIIRVVTFRLPCAAARKRRGPQRLLRWDPGVRRWSLSFLGSDEVKLALAVRLHGSPIIPYFAR